MTLHICGDGAQVRIIGLDRLPLLTGVQNRPQKCVLALAGADGSGPIFPEQTHGNREDRVYVLGIVTTLTPAVLNRIARELKRPLHRLVAHPPIAELGPTRPFVVGSVLDENPDRLGLGLAYQYGVAISPTHTNKSTDSGEHSPEC